MKYRREYDLRTIGRNLKYYRKKNHYSVEYVREYLRLGSNQAIYKWESGGGYPQADTMLSLMELYGIGGKELLGESRESYYDSTVMNSYIFKEMKLTEGKAKQLEFEKRIRVYYLKSIIMQMKAAVG